ncbi:MAG: ATP-binding protein [Spongiibacteraceae bacterium]
MTLNKQLLCVSIILLCLPWAGCQYIREVDNIFRTSQEQTLMASTKAVASVLSQQAALLQTYNSDEHFTPLYFHPLASSLWIDGYSEGWESIPAIPYQAAHNPQQSVTVRSAIHNKKLFLYFQVIDNNVIYNNPAQSLIDDGDGIAVIAASGRQYIFTTSAPGNVIARYRNETNRIYRESKINAYWQDTEAGYDLEVSLPTELAAGRLSFYIIDQNADNIRSNNSEHKETSNNHTTDYYGPMANAPHSRPPYYIYQSAALQQQLDIFEQPGQRINVVEPHYWLLAKTGTIELPKAIEQRDTTENSHWLIKKLYRFLLNSNIHLKTQYSESTNFSERLEVIRGFDGHSNSRWYKDPEHSSQNILAVAVPVFHNKAEATEANKQNIIGVVVAEQSSEQLAALSDNAFNKLLALSLGAIILVAIALLGYTSWLSWRIKRLSRAATEVLSDDGKLLDNFPTSRAADEIGDLTRNYAQLLQRIGDYTEYLQTLSRKLSHELRTPLAIIHSSLDNLNNQPLDPHSETYQQRAKQGAIRLGNILTAMSEASRVEASIENAELETIDLFTLLSGVSAAYQDIYPQHRINFSSSNGFNYTIQAVPDLLVQMLDKLIDNAASFCPENGLIGFTLSHHNKYIEITVSNDGPLLPEKMRSQLFNNMVSLREQNKNSSHLGLGLYIVSLIVQFHHGSISAANRDDASGVFFTIHLPT